MGRGLGDWDGDAETPGRGTRGRGTRGRGTRGRGTPGRGDAVKWGRGTRGRGTRECADAEILLNYIDMRESL